MENFEKAIKRIVVLVHGLPGSGKTTLADMLAAMSPIAVRINADTVRSTISSDLGFSIEDRITQAKRMGMLAAMMLQGATRIAVVDFVCPTQETRAAFLQSIPNDVLLYTVHMGTIKPEESRFKDTAYLYEPPAPHTADYPIQTFLTKAQFQLHCNIILQAIEQRLLIRTFRVEPCVALSETNTRKWMVTPLDSGRSSVVNDVSFHTHAQNIQGVTNANGREPGVLLVKGTGVLVFNGPMRVVHSSDPPEDFCEFKFF